MQHLPKHPDSVGGRQAGRQAEAGGQKKNKAGILSPLSGINQQCENILDSGEKTGQQTNRVSHSADLSCCARHGNISCSASAEENMHAA